MPALIEVLVESRFIINVSSYYSLVSAEKQTIVGAVNREVNVVSRKDNDDSDRELIAEINRRYAEAGGEDDLSVVSGRRRFYIGAVALVLALLFIFTVTGRWLSVFAGPTFVFLRESWALSDDPLVRELRDAVVLVTVDNRSGPSRQLRGTGFNIESSGLIITNRHLIDDAAIIRVSFPGRGTFIAEEWSASTHVDLAVLNLQAEDLPTVSLSEKRINPGEEVIVIGNPMQFARIANKGLMAGYLYHGSREIPLLVVEAMIYPGSSGSPLFNEQGEVVGIVFATLPDGDPSEVRGLAVDVGELKLFLGDLLAQ